MNLLNILGFLAGSCTTLAVIPQLYKSWKHGEAKQVSMKMYLVLLTGLLLWFFYGVGINDYPIMIFNGLAFCLNLSMLYFILKSRKKLPKL